MFRFKLKTMLLAIMFCGVAFSTLRPFAWTSVSANVTRTTTPRGKWHYYHSHLVITNRGLLPVWYSSDVSFHLTCYGKVPANSSVERRWRDVTGEGTKIEITDWLGNKQVIWAAINEQP